MHPISRSSKMKAQVNAGLSEKLSPFTIKPAIKVIRAHSLAESKKNSKLMMKSTKHPRTRLEIDTFLRLSKTPTPPLSVSSQVTDNKLQEINQLNKEIQNLKAELNKANQMIESLKKCSKCESYSSLLSKSLQYQSLLSGLIQKSLSSPEVSLTFKQELSLYILPLKAEPWALPLSALITTSLIPAPLQTLQTLPDPSLPSSSSPQNTARFHSLRGSACKPMCLGQGLVMENFNYNSLWLHTGDRVSLVQKPSESEWEVECQGVVFKIPSRFILID